jgi:hypothetical protein
MLIPEKLFKNAFLPQRKKKRSLRRGVSAGVFAFSFLCAKEKRTFQKIKNRSTMSGLKRTSKETIIFSPVSLNPQW